MNATTQGAVANVGGSGLLLLPSLMDLVPPQYRAIATAVIAIGGFAVNQYLIHKAQHQLPSGIPIPPMLTDKVEPAPDTNFGFKSAGFALLDFCVALIIGSVLIAVLVTVTGCTNTTASQDVGIKSAIQLTTIELIKQASDPAERAMKVRAMADEARGIVAGDQTATLSTIEDAVRAQLHLEERLPEEQILISNFLQLLHAELQQRFGEGVLSPEQRVKVGEALDWIVEATMAFPAPKPPEAGLLKSLHSAFG